MHLLDGPIGTELARRGVCLPLPAWSANANLTHPDIVYDIVRDYVAAGATSFITNTFRTTPTSMGDEWRRGLIAAVQLSRSAIPPTAQLLGSLAPVDDCYRPDLSPPDAEDRHRVVAQALADAGVDAILCETFAHPGEAVAAVRASVATGLPVWLALTPGPHATLMSPSALRRVGAEAFEAGAKCVLVNCVDHRLAESYVQALASLGGRWGAYPNAGEDFGVVPLHRARRAGLAKRMVRWRDQGAHALGLCCGFTPQDLARLAVRLVKRG